MRTMPTMFVVFAALAVSACATSGDLRSGGVPSFAQSDLNADNQVTREEFAQVWGGSDRRFNYADANGDDLISRNEFWRTRPFARNRLLPRRER